MVLFAFRGGFDKEAADVGMVGAGAWRGVGGGFAAVESGGGSGNSVGQCGFSPVEGGWGSISRRTRLRESGGAGKEEVRRHVEGQVYGSIEAKRAAVEEVLRRLEREGRLSTLVGWSYVREAFRALPK